MRKGDTLRKRTLRLALSAINQSEIDQRRTLPDPEVFAILQKEIKARREALEDAKRASRQDLIDQALSEIEVLEEYLPPPLSQEEIEALVRSAIAEVGAGSAKDMGQVMKVLLPRVQGRAENAQVSQIVRQMLG
jgi:hypothetical protein